MQPALRACNVPVFRYAMERWQPDSYHVVVYHSGAPSGPAFDLLQKGAKGRARANYSLQTVAREAAARHGISEYPWVEVYYPQASCIPAPVFSGRLTTEGARAIVRSAARSRLAQRLLAGEIAVWVLVKSGHEEKDRRAAETLRTNLEWASANLRIPETGVDAEGRPIEVTDFKRYRVRFGWMEIARDDPGEQLLVNTLLRSEPDLESYQEPMAFPVFGRGRVLYALVGGGIREKNIREACQSMLAWCSCEIKAQNPGADLLVAADWSRPSGGRMVKEPEVPLTGIGSFLPEKPPPPTATAPVTPAPVPDGDPLMRRLLYLAGAAGVALGVFSLLLRRKAKRL